MNVLITRKIPEIGIQLLQNHFDVEVNDSHDSLSPADLKKRIADKQAILCLLTDKIDRELIDAAPGLKVISNHAVGYDNIDVDYATRKGIAVTNTPGVLTEATADFTWSLLMAIARNVALGDRIVRGGKFSGWDPLFLRGADFTGKVLGIIGAGRIGSAVAERSAGWKMKILYVDRNTNSFLESKLQAQRTTLPELLKASDFVSIHLPLTPETHHLIDKVELELMKPTAYLINTSRGPIVNEAILTEALANRKIAGAALDVFEHEPQLTAGLADLENVLLTPHIGSATFSARNKMAETAAQNIIRVLNGQPPISIVNPEMLQD